MFSSLHGSKVLQDSDPILDIDQQHPALNVGLSVPAVEVSRHVSIPYFKNCNLNAVFTSIQSFSYSAFTGDVNEAFSLLTEKVRNAVLSNTHIRRIGSYRFPCWFTRDLKDLIIQKEILHKKYKETLSLQVYHKFDRIRRLQGTHKGMFGLVCGPCPKCAST